MRQIRQARNWSQVGRNLLRGGAIFASTHCLPLLLHAAPQAVTAQTWGPKFATAGTSLEFRSSGSLEESKASRRVAVYTLGVSGFEPSATIELWIWRVGEEPQLLVANLRVDNGMVVCDETPPATAGQIVICARNNRAAEISIAARLAEPVAIGLITLDTKTKVFGKVVPFPLDVTQGTCRLSIEREDKNGTLFLAGVTGLRPNESLRVVLTSENEKANVKGTADATGTWGTVVSPVVKGRTTGAANISLRSESCNAQLDYRWGTAESPR